MNQSQIENMAVSSLSMVVDSCKKLKSFIANGDKKNTWDGSICIFGDNNHTNKSVRNVPVQVKGTTKGKVGATTISYPVEIIQLQNYSANGGVMFFVVLVKGTQPYSIFYKMLLPQDIEGLLITVSKTQKTKNLRLKLLDSNSLPLIMNHFIENMHLNRKIYDATIFEKVRQLNVKAIINSGDIAHNMGAAQLEKILNSDSMYLYAVPNPEEFPSEQLPIKKSLSNFRVWEVVDLYDFLTIEGKVYQIKGTRVKMNDECKIYIGANPNYWERSIVIYERKDLHDNQIDITIKGSLNQRILDAEFALLLFKKSLGEKAQKIEEILIWLKQQRKKLDESGLFSDVIIADN